MIHRRTFLERIGLLGLGLGLGNQGVSKALGQTSRDAPPKRLVVISHCHGWPYSSWNMRPPGVASDAPWQIPLNSIPQDQWSKPLAPLYGHRSALIAIDGLSLATAELDMDGNRHDTGWVHAWTGGWADFSGADTRSTTASIDQIVAQHIARSDRLPSLELSLDDSGENGRPVSYGQNGLRLPVEADPARVWQRLFGAQNGQYANESSIAETMSYAFREFQSIAPRLDTQSRIKLEAHFDLFNQLKGRLDGMANLRCPQGPDTPSPATNYDEKFDAMSELIGAAFSCDLTRVVSVSLGELPTRDFGWDHLTDDVHKGLAHGIYDDPVKHEAMTDYLHRHSLQVSRFVDLLAGLPDINGSGSILDNTLIVWGSELADGWHGYQHYCPVLIGGSWHFNTGQYQYRPHQTPIRILTRDGYTDRAGLPHQKLLVSIAQAMGLAVDQIGLNHVQTQTGHRLDISGALTGLT